MCILFQMVNYGKDYGKWNNLLFISKYVLISQSDSAHQIKNYPRVCKWFLINKELISAIQLLITIIKLNNKKLKS